MKVFPGAQVSSKRVDKYPIKVTIQAETPDAELVDVWKGNQKDLFAKYGWRALPAINTALETLKKQIGEASE